MEDVRRNVAENRFFLCFSLCFVAMPLVSGVGVVLYALHANSSAIAQLWAVGDIHPVLPQLAIVWLGVVVFTAFARSFAKRRVQRRKHLSRLILFGAMDDIAIEGGRVLVHVVGSEQSGWFQCPPAVVHQLLTPEVREGKVPFGRLPECLRKEGEAEVHHLPQSLQTRPELLQQATQALKKWEEWARTPVAAAVGLVRVLLRVLLGIEALPDSQSDRLDFKARLEADRRLGEALVLVYKAMGRRFWLSCRMSAADRSSKYPVLAQLETLETGLRDHLHAHRPPPVP